MCDDSQSYGPKLINQRKIISMEPKYKFIKFRVYSLDVWGHGPEEHEDYDCDGECDGYTVNDRFKCGDVEIFATLKTYNVGTENEFSDYVSEDRHIVGALKRFDYLKMDVPVSLIDVDGDDEFIEINDFYDGCPLFQLEREQI